MILFRQFDLSLVEDVEKIDEILDAPNLRPIELNVGCTETGYTTLLVHAHQTPEPIRRKRKRRFRRFVLFNGMNEQLNQLLENETTRIIKRNDFFTEQGVIIVLDYEINPEE